MNWPRRIAIDKDQSMLDTDLVKQGARQETDVARIIVEFDHTAKALINAERPSCGAAFLRMFDVSPHT
jgi:hypothetical protein